MKINLATVLITTVVYVGLLFIVALLSSRLFKKDRRYIYNPIVYSLTLGVYCTAWTYYGSVGRATMSGIEFLAIYIGPTLMVFSWWFLLRKMISISERHNINNIADFVSFRYGRSKRIGIIVSFLCIVGVVPYISLQLKAISETFLIVSGKELSYNLPFYLDTAFYISFFMGILASSFGVHHIGESRKHPGLVGVIAFESVVKLSIFLLVGVYSLKFMNGFSGFLDYLYNNSDLENISKLLTLEHGENSYGKWFAMITMSMFAVMFLPRQFQMAVVENGAAKHVKTAMYLFPLYLFLINLFVIPIAIAGKVFLVSGYNPDYTVLGILKKDNSPILSIITYLGGLSAATGMIIVSTVSLSNMFVNNIVVNLFIKYFLKRNIGMYITHIKRISVVGIIFFSYLFYHVVGENLSLVDLGLISFAAIAQVAPSIIIGLFVKGISKVAIFYGILSGTIIWFYTLIIPYSAKAGLISEDILNHGLFNIEFLNPSALFGLHGLNQWSHSLFWSMFFNIFFIVLLTLFKEQNEEEKETASLCVDSLGFHFLLGRSDVSKRLSLIDVENILTNFFGADYSKKMVNEFLKEIGKSKNELDSSDINIFVKKAKDNIAQAVGPSAADIILNYYMEISGKGDRDVFNMFKDLVNLGLGESRDTLIHRITELNLLLEISKQFSSTTDLINKLQHTADMIRTTLRFDLVVIRKKKEDVLETLVSSGDINSFKMISHIRKIDFENTFIGRSIANVKPIYINDIEFSDETTYASELKNKGVKSFCHIPLVIDGVLEGVISLFSKNYKNMFHDDFTKILESIAQQLAFLINNHNKNEELIKVKEVSKELEIAKMIQSYLVNIEKSGYKGFTVESSYSPSVYVGGDYYDIIYVNDSIVDIVIADVSGHNMASALIMSQMRSIIRTTLIIRPEITPAGVLRIITKEIFPQINKHDFIITALYMRFNTNNGEIYYCNAGHYPPIIINDGNIIEGEGSDILIGVLEDYSYREFKLKLDSQDMMILYTDGVIEAENEFGEFYGKERFISLLREHAYMDPPKIKNAILSSILNFTKNSIQRDDISLLIIKKD